MYFFPSLSLPDAIKTLEKREREKIESHLMLKMEKGRQMAREEEGEERKNKCKK